MMKRLMPTGGNDIVMTPPEVASHLIKHFKPTGKTLEPCRGSGAFYTRLPVPKDWCELSEGKDFFDYEERVDWIITNPPFSKLRPFLQHSMRLADNVVFLTSINHFWLKARIRDIIEAGFWFKEILIIDTPDTFPQSGFQIGAVHLARGYSGETRVSTSKNLYKRPATPFSMMP